MANEQNMMVQRGPTREINGGGHQTDVILPAPQKYKGILKSKPTAKPEVS